MGGYKSLRAAEDIKRELSGILRGMKDPRVRMDMLSIVRVEVSGDLSVAKVFVSTMDGIEKTKKAVEGLENGMGFIKGQLSSRLRIRKCPELKFIADDSIAYGMKLNEIIEDLKKEDDDGTTV